MPNVVGMTVTEAEREVLAAGKSVRATSARAIVAGYRESNLERGRIASQTERVGRTMYPYWDDVGGKYGEVTFTVYLSSGPRPAPDFTGKSERAARELAQRERVALSFGAAKQNFRVPKGLVSEQRPDPGEPMSRSRVTAYLSDGYPLPNYKNQTVNAALRDSGKLGFTVVQQAERNLLAPAGIVFDQNPPPDTLLPLRGPVTLKVSQGWPVPRFIGQPESAGDKLAQRYRIDLVKQAQDNARVPVGEIFDQQPPADELIPDNRKVNVTLSAGYPLPDLLGHDEAYARQVAKTLGFELTISRQPEREHTAGKIAGQTPAAGTRLPLDSPVAVVASEGWRTPDFLKLEENQARSLADEKQVALAVTERVDRATQPGIVFDQSPEPDTLLPPGRPVEILVSSGFPTPRFIEMQRSEAESRAAQNSIRLNVEKTANVDIPAGLVFDQSPKPGTPLPADSRVSVSVSSGWPVPDFVGQSEERALATAEANKITLVTVGSREDFDLRPGYVVTQLPEPGDAIPADRHVQILLSLGWPIAPDAVGRQGRNISQAFSQAHPNATVALNERVFTLQAAGTVLSQTPKAGLKLGRDQKLELVIAAEKPVWFWPATGAAALTALCGGGLLARRYRVQVNGRTPVEQGVSPQADNPGDVTCKVTRDPGSQLCTGAAADTEDAQAADSILHMKVSVDLGEQTIHSVAIEGEEG